MSAKVKTVFRNPEIGVLCDHSTKAGHNGSHVRPIFTFQPFSGETFGVRGNRGGAPIPCRAFLHQYFVKLFREAEARYDAVYERAGHLDQRAVLVSVEQPFPVATVGEIERGLKP